MEGWIRFPRRSSSDAMAKWRMFMWGLRGRMNIRVKSRVSCVTSLRTIRKALVCMLLPPAAALAQQNKIAVQPPAQLTIRQGAIGTAKLHLMTLPGFHVNSDKPGGTY